MRRAAVVMHQRSISRSSFIAQLAQVSEFYVQQVILQRQDRIWAAPELPLATIADASRRPTRNRSRVGRRVWVSGPRRSASACVPEVPWCSHRPGLLPYPCQCHTRRRPSLHSVDSSGSISRLQSSSASQIRIRSRTRRNYRPQSFAGTELAGTAGITSNPANMEPVRTRLTTSIIENPPVESNDSTVSWRRLVAQPTSARFAGTGGAM